MYKREKEDDPSNTSLLFLLSPIHTFHLHISCLIFFPFPQHDPFVCAYSLNRPDIRHSSYIIEWRGKLSPLTQFFRRIPLWTFFRGVIPLAFMVLFGTVILSRAAGPFFSKNDYYFFIFVIILFWVNETWIESINWCVSYCQFIMTVTSSQNGSTNFHSNQVVDFVVDQNKDWKTGNG